MENIKISKHDQIIMSLVHYFITVENYAPLVVKGAKDEVWLENLEAPIKVIRLNSNYIRNDEQLEYDILKLLSVLKQVKKNTFTINMKSLNICLNVEKTVNLSDYKMVKNLSFKTIGEVQNSEYLLSLFPKLATLLVVKSESLKDIKEVTEEINMATNNRNALFEKLFTSKKIIMTYILIALCSSIFFIDYLFLNGFLINLCAGHGFLFKNGEYYRALTSIFFHGDLFHLFFNMYSLTILGNQVENIVGKTKFLGIFLISGLMGSLFSMIFNDEMVYSVGASGAIFGLAASLLYFGYTYRVYFNSVIIKQLVPIILINLYIGFAISTIDNAAHIGGLVGGYLASAMFGISGKSEKSEQINSMVALILIFAALLYFILFK